MANVNKAGKGNLLDKNSYVSNYQSQLVYMNDGVRLCSEACSCCWDTPLPNKYEDKVEYLAKRARIGHTSIFEHSNIIMLIKMPTRINNINAELLDFISSVKYLNVRYAIAASNTETISSAYLLIGGSIRGYHELFELSKAFNDNHSRALIDSVAKVLYETVDSRLLPDLIKENKLAEENFLNIEPDPISPYFNDLLNQMHYTSDKVNFVSVDNTEQIKKNLKTIIGEDIFTYEDISRVSSLTILFKDMSRTATHQLVRHRNAITQESQRYVDYSDAAFADPCDFKPDKYDKNKVYDIEFQGAHFSLTSEQLGEAIIGFYDNMREQGMLKEDARAFLPGNVKCRKLYMTFTHATFMKFLELRTDPHAQAEIRSFALDCLDGSKEIFESMKETIKTTSVDEIISDKEEIFENIVKNTDELKEGEK